MSPVPVQINLNDRCPVCRTALKNLLIDIGEKHPDGTYTKILLQSDMFSIVCTSCGTHFTPKSAIPQLVKTTGEMERASKSKIIDPTRPQGGEGLYMPGGLPPNVDLKTGKLK